MKEIHVCDLCGGIEFDVVTPPHAHQTFVAAHGTFTLEIGSLMCRRCGFVFLSPRMDKEELDVYYANQKRYVKDLKELSVSEYGRLCQMQIDLIKKFCRGERGRALEVGSADVLFLSLLRQEGFSPEGIEPALSYKEFCERHFPEIPVHWAMLEDVDLPCEAFSVCCLRHVLEHVDSPLAVMKRINCSLKTGGIVYIEVPNLSRAQVAIYDYFHEQHLSYFTEQAIKFLCSSTGFSCDLVEAWEKNPEKSGFYYPVLRVIARKTGGDGGADRCVHNAEGSRAAVTDYFRRREKFLEETIALVTRKITQWCKDGKRVALFGAGPHTAKLLQHFDMPPTTFLCAFDNDTSKWGKEIGGVVIVSPRDVGIYHPDVVIISSREFETDIFQSLRAWQDAGIHIEKIYNL